MRPQAQLYVTSARGFRRAPSRCQIVWQGILILATLALAVAANAQSSCFDLFASRNAPLRPGSSVTIHYSFSRALPDMLESQSVRLEVAHSALRESRRLQAEGGVLRSQLQKLNAGRETKKTIIAMAEIATKIHDNQARFASVGQIEQLAKTGGKLSAQELSLLSSHKFEQKFDLNSKSDAKLLASRLGELDGNLATYDPVKYPDGRIKRIYNLAIKHKIIAVILVSVAAGLASQGYDLYVSAQQDAQRGTVTQIYDEGIGNALVAPANSPSEAIGN
jgi:hypothetical protein